MKLARILLLLNGMLFVIFGIAFIMIPEFSARLLIGAAPLTASAIIDMRATYGAMLGMGVFFATCALRRSWIPPGVTALVSVLGSIALGRLVGLVFDSGANAMVYVSIALELLFFSLSLSAILQLRMQVRAEGLLFDTRPARTNL